MGEGVVRARIRLGGVESLGGGFGEECGIREGFLGGVCSVEEGEF